MSKFLKALSYVSPVAVVAGGVKKVNKSLNDTVKNRPEYNIQDEYAQNQAIAANLATGRDRSVQNAEQRIDQGAANAFENATQATNSTPALLATLTGINASTSAAKNDLVDQEQNARARGTAMMMQTNNQMAEEKDKAWNYNVNDPYQNKVQRLRDKQKFNRDLLMKGIDLTGSLAVKAATGGIA